MSNIDASTPQLKTVKNLFDAITALDLGNIATLLSKNYRYEAFNGATDDLAKLDRERYAEAVRGFFAGMTKLDVSIQQRRATMNPTD